MLSYVIFLQFSIYIYNINRIFALDVLIKVEHI